ncbi:ribonuclease H-like protein [Aspergillus ibericus CBS 121593]|uniref:Ribonuclease H-like protein n=1 Tax=Aspergillus ibericus CBS 121593 TaxID=1448316 RepID=A0A395HAL3_9EURO|nr:ribonuclease H-like protein [Aspergillus ibericus CBS 121593]RAL04543.1 ribonuclease H-like protein [Aspergillus ibericus CBS 121593]
MTAVAVASVSVPKPNPVAQTCPVCQRRTFKTVKALRAHQQTLRHLFPCTDCDKEFIDSKALEQHRIVHAKPEKPWACSKCTRKFASEKALADHHASHSRPLKQIACNICNRKFKTSPALSQHVLSHQEADSAPKPQSATGTLPAPTPASASATIPQSSDIEEKITQSVPPSHQLSALSPDLAIANVVANHPYNSNRFAVLGPSEKDLRYLELREKCHPISRLLAQGFRMIAFTDQREPRKGTVLGTQFQNTPPSPMNRHQKRKAVVIDCEMVTVTSGRRHIASIAAVDFLTGEVLLNQYVYPEAKIVNYNTRYSGISHATMMAAVRNGAALRGWEAAREALWEHVDQDTVLIGHALQNDLSIMGIIHSRIVDSQILTGEAIFPKLSTSSPLPRLTGLKALASELTEYDIQAGRKGHTALEDAYATRDVVIWCLRYPQLLESWADMAKKRYEQIKKQDKERREMRKAKKKATKKQPQSRGGMPPRTQGYRYCEDSEMEHWSDIAEACGYPHPDTGYDPWSD